MNTRTITATPVVSISHECEPALRKGLKDTRSFYAECVVNLSYPGAQPDDHDAETYGRWISQIQWLELLLSGRGSSHTTDAAREDGYAGVEAFAIREAVRDVAKFRADQFAYEVGAEHSNWDQLETFAERKAALAEVSCAMELWEIVYSATSDLADGDLVELVIEGASS